MSKCVFAGSKIYTVMFHLYSNDLWTLSSAVVHAGNGVINGIGTEQCFYFSVFLDFIPPDNNPTSQHPTDYRREKKKICKQSTFFPADAPVKRLLCENKS